MKRNRAHSTAPEVALRKALSQAGLRGYRLNWKKAPGRPDICFVGKRLAVFVHGCFWHRCPYCSLSLPKTNSEFWARKFQLNVERDAAKVAALERDSWTVLTFWECSIRLSLQDCVDTVRLALADSSGEG
jgi:DNA mismatch endonuclease (patch repair protein)